MPALSAPPIATQLVLDLPREDVLHVLAVFDEETQRLSKLLKATAVAGDATAFRRAAHALAGAAGAVGATVLESAARGGMAPEGHSPARMLEVADEIAELSGAARREAAAVVADLDKADDEA
jgi:HPt (histidine-containing phosphotransfer) domain-containing protein